jgi:formate hydrogenlyase subunit 3/multisubunit Na+/H+ antiporter MnhD subunit
MTAILLMLLAGLAAVLLTLAAAGVMWPRRSSELVRFGTAGLCAVGELLALLTLVADGPPAALAFLVGPPGAVLALDPLAALFLLPVFLAVGAAAIATRASPGLPAVLAPMVVTVLAGDAFTLAFGLSLGAILGWGPQRLRRQHAAAAAGRRELSAAVAAAASLVAALALISPGFAAVRAVPPESWRATGVLLLALLAGAILVGLTPAHRLPMRVKRVAPAESVALLSPLSALLGIYLLVRIVFDCCGPAQPPWWGFPLLALGALTAVAGGLQAVGQRALEPIIAGFGVQQAGVAAIGLGVALIARAEDQLALAALALAGTLLQAAVMALGQVLALLCAAAVHEGAGSRRLDRLGRLIEPMPVTSVCLMAGCLAFTVLPPGPGFAAFWLVVQSVLGAVRLGGPLVQGLLILAVALLGLSAGLAATGAVRLIGVACLGRPRTPRAAAAQEARRPARWAMGGLAVVLALVGLLPGVALRIAEPALRALTGSGMASRADALTVTVSTGTPGYAALPLAAVVTLAGGAAFWLLRAVAPAGRRDAPGWRGGFAAPPPWLPFGDPVTQAGPADFAGMQFGSASALRRADAWRIAAIGRLRRILERPRWVVHAGDPRRAVLLLLGVIAVILAVLAAGVAP